MAVRIFTLSPHTGPPDLAPVLPPQALPLTKSTVESPGMYPLLGPALPAWAAPGRLAPMQPPARVWTSFAAVILHFLTGLNLSAHAAQGQIIRFNRPAERWVDALPVGNGKLGAMVFGGVRRERIQLNEDSVWAGPPVPVNADDLGPKLAEIRQLFFAGRNAEGQARVAREILVPEINPRSHQTLGDLWIEHLEAGDTFLPLELRHWMRSPENAPMEPAIHQPGFASPDWQPAVTFAQRQVPPGRSVLFRTEFRLSADLLRTLQHPLRLSLDPIDDQGILFLDGREIGRTTDYSRSYKWTLPPLPPGPHVLVVQVTNTGGPGHFARTVTLEAPEQPGTGYERWLDLQTAVVTTRYTWQTVHCQREVSASAPDQVLAVRITAPGTNRLNLRIRLDRPADFTTRSEGQDTLLMEGQAQHDGRHPGVRWLAALRVLPDHGTVTAETNVLIVRGSSSVRLLLAAVTDYNFLDPSQPLTHDRRAVCLERIHRAAAFSWEELRARAVADHRALFDRCWLNLGDTPPQRAALSTPDRLEAFRKDRNDPDLIETYFQFGRYLLIASSRPGSLPANLQGLWNEHLRAPWNADYHININLQMNYWPAEVTGLPELTEPFFRLLQGLRRSGSELARKLGCRGFAATHTTDAWLWAALIGSPGYGMWPLGAAWCTAHAMEHYRFTGDRHFLEQVGYPLLRESAAFLLDWLVEDPETGQLVSGPTTSPENTYLDQGRRLALAMGNAMDQMIIRENFENLLEAAAALQKEDPLLEEVRRALPRLARPRLGPDGRILEWGRPYEEAEPGHRHISHLYGLHPGHQINPWDEPDLLDAARKVLEYRLRHGGGHTGWSRAWIINFYARLLDGQNAWDNLCALLEKSTLPNLFDTHPPFQIDGNFGGCAGIAEMLLQSHDRRGTLRLLPALPPAWPHGEARGLRARGGFIVDLRWQDGRPEHVRIRSLLGRPCRVAWKDQTAEWPTRPGETFELDGQLRRLP